MTSEAPLIWIDADYKEFDYLRNFAASVSNFEFSMKEIQLSKKVGFYDMRSSFVDV